MRETGRIREIEEATNLRQAWVVAAAWIGLPPTPDYTPLTPDYAAMPRKLLQSELHNLRSEFRSILKIAFGQSATNTFLLRAMFFFQQFYEDFLAFREPFSICTVQELVSVLGWPLPLLRLDAPPYAEVLMQGIRGAAYRHPEYMIARDVEGLHNLFWQTEDLIVAHMKDWPQPNWLGNAGEQVQGLGRATILSCFSLLESTVSGLARAHVMSTSGMSLANQKELLDNHGPLLERLLLVPELITGKPSPLTKTAPPLNELFGSIKERRDAFVHCEPGMHRDKRGFVKQERFHDVSDSVVDSAVDLTVGVVQKLWRHVHSTDVGPAWLGRLGDRSAYPQSLSLSPRTGV
jgi:hypothetical protein